MSYDYEYTGTSFADGSLQGNEMSSYPPEFVRPRQHQAAPSTSGQQRRRPQEVPPFVPYESAMLYGFGQQGPAPGPFEVVPQYPPRQSAAIEALSNQFAVPQYFTPEEPSATGVPVGLSPYLNAEMPYNQPGPMARPSTMQPFPANMTDFAPIGGPTGRLEHPPQQHQQQQHQQHQADSSEAVPVDESSTLDEAYAQYRRALRSTFDHTRAGRLVEASRSLLEISEWLVANARDLGRFGSFPCSFIFYLAGGTMLVQGCCRAPERAERSYHNRTPAWALFFKPGTVFFLPLCFFSSLPLRPARTRHTSII
jgi:hypothetical protein